MSPDIIYSIVFVLFLSPLRSRIFSAKMLRRVSAIAPRSVLRRAASRGGIRRHSSIPAIHARHFDLISIRQELESEHAMEGTAYATASAPWRWLDREMSSNIAGETGAVYIYVGAAAALRWRGGEDAAIVQFVEEHRAAEQSHFHALLPEHKRTRLLPMWRIAGFSLGFAPAFISDRALFMTVEAVETFVEEHYHEQIGSLRAHGRCPALLALLEHCCADEVHHKEDAAARRAGGGEATAIEHAWMSLVRMGSAVAAEIARRM